MKGIILAGGSGTRLYPMTASFSKHLLPVYDKPMLYYPLSILMLMGVDDIVMIATTRDIPLYKSIFGDGSRFGIKISYVVQDVANGIAEAILLSEKYHAGHNTCLILGDNIFYIPNYKDFFKEAIEAQEGATIFGYHVQDPQRYGVVEMDSNGKAIAIEEKPSNPKTNLAVPGIYFYDKNVFEIAKNIKPSGRGELEITDVNNAYIAQGKLNVKIMGRGCVWLDSGTSDSLLESSHLIQTIENRQNIKVACLEEIAVNMGYVDKKDMKETISFMKGQSSYVKYLREIASSW